MVNRTAWESWCSEWTTADWPAVVRMAIWMAFSVAGWWEVVYDDWRLAMGCAKWVQSEGDRRCCDRWRHCRCPLTQRRWRLRRPKDFSNYLLRSLVVAPSDQSANQTMWEPFGRLRFLFRLKAIDVVVFGCLTRKKNTKTKSQLLMWDFGLKLNSLYTFNGLINRKYANICWIFKNKLNGLLSENIADSRLWLLNNNTYTQKNENWLKTKRVIARIRKKNRGRIMGCNWGHI